MQSRRWCFTINNYTDEEVSVLDGYECKYMVYGIEKGAEGTPHLQGFVVCNNNVKLGGMKKLNNRAHWEAAKGTSQQASDYCKKDGNFKERGTLPLDNRAAGGKNKERWDEVKENAKRGKLDDIPSDIYIKYYRTLKAIASDHQVRPEAVAELDNWWYFGATGTGKSSAARKISPDYYLKRPNKWWDGYVDQSVVIIEEWGPEYKMLGSFLKEWADHHPFAAEVKGGMKCIRPKQIIVTSNYSMEECFEDKAVLAPLKRRFKVKHFRELAKHDEDDKDEKREREEFVADCFE